MANFNIHLMIYNSKEQPPAPQIFNIDKRSQAYLSRLQQHIKL